MKKPAIINDHTRVCVIHDIIDSPVYVAYVSGSSKQKVATIPKAIYDHNMSDFSGWVPGTSKFPVMDTSAHTELSGGIVGGAKSSSINEGSEGDSPSTKKKEAEDKVRLFISVFVFS